MAVSAVNVLHGIVTPSSFYSQISDATPSPNVQAMMGAPSGHPQPLFRGVRGLKPDITFRTTQLATLFGEFPTSGMCAADLSAGNVDLLYKAVTDKGVREAAASTVHNRLRLQDAMVYVRSLSFGHQREAEADVRCLALYDGTNNPIVPAGSVALSGTPTAAEYFALGPVVINGSVVDGVMEGSLNLNHRTIEVGSASEHYDTFGAIAEWDPQITLRGHMLGAWTSYGINGTALTSLAIYLRKMNVDAASGLPYVANGTGAHIAITASAGLITVENSQGGGNSEATTGLRLDLRAANSSASAVTIATAQTIP